MILTNELAQKYIYFHSNELFNEFEKQYKRVMDFENRKEKYLSKKIEKIKDVLEKAELTKHGFKFKYADGDGIMFFCGAKYSETAEYQNENGINYYNEIAYYFENHIVLGNDLPRIGETFYKPYKGDIFSIPDDYKPIPADESDIFNIFIKELTAYVIFDYYKKLLDFKKSFAPVAPVVQSESTAPPAEKEKENVFCPSMPLSVPIEHFKLFTTERNNEGVPYLSVTDFDKFIDRAFCGNTDIEKLSFQLGKREKSKIVEVFYKFFNQCLIYENTDQCKEKYVRLLTDNFNVFDFNGVFANFNKSPKKGI